MFRWAWYEVNGSYLNDAEWVYTCCRHSTRCSVCLLWLWGSYPECQQAGHGWQQQTFQPPSLSSRHPTLERRKACLNSPEHQLGENLVWPTAKKDNVIFLFSPVKIRHAWHSDSCSVRCSCRRADEESLRQGCVYKVVKHADHTVRPFSTVDSLVSKVSWWSYTVYTKTHPFNGKTEMMFYCVWLRTRAYVLRGYTQYVRISIRVPRPTQDRMNFSRFRRLVSRSASSGSVPRYCYIVPLWYRHRGCLVFGSGTSYWFAPNSKFHSARKDRKMDEWVQLSRRKYSRRRIGSYNIASLVAKV